MKVFGFPNGQRGVMNDAPLFFKKGVKMKKVLLILLFMLLIVCLSGCFRTKTDQNGNFIEDVQAIICISPDKTITVRVKEYSIGSACVYILADDGTRYKTAIQNVTIIYKELKIE